MNSQGIGGKKTKKIVGNQASFGRPSNAGML